MASSGHGRWLGHSPSFRNWSAIRPRTRACEWPFGSAASSRIGEARSAGAGRSVGGSVCGGGAGDSAGDDGSVITGTARFFRLERERDEILQRRAVGSGGDFPTSRQQALGARDSMRRPYSITNVRWPRRSRPTGKTREGSRARAADAETLGERGCMTRSHTSQFSSFFSLLAPPEGPPRHA